MRFFYKSLLINEEEVSSRKAKKKDDALGRNSKAAERRKGIFVKDI
jgi:hypothetical protein